MTEIKPSPNQTTADSATTAQTKSSPPPASKTPEQLKLEAKRRAQLQVLGKQVVAQLFTALRTIRIHDRNNTSVLVASEHLKDSLNAIYGVMGHIKLEFVEDQLYLSDQRVRVDSSAYNSVRELAAAFAERGLGGLSLTRPVTTQTLVDLLHVFKEVQGDEAAADMRERLTSMRDLAVELLVQRRFHDGEEAASDAKISIDPRLRALQCYAKATIGVKRFVNDILQQNPTQQGSAQLRLVRVVQDFVDLSSERANLLIKLLAIKEGSDYQFLHAVNVCVLSIAMGRSLGLNRIDLVDLGLAGMMSDLGFALAKPALLNKAAKLSDDEVTELHQHVITAVRLLLGRGALSRTGMRLLIVAFQHHRHFDLQGGYPDYLVEGPLHLFSRIIAIADSYDAMTTNRSWREAFSPDEALRNINEGAGRIYDPDLVRVFINLLGLYPVGTALRLDNGEIAVVYHSSDDPERFDRPFVRLLRDVNGQAVERTVIRDLSEKDPLTRTYKYSIAHVVEPGQLSAIQRSNFVG